MKVNNIKIKYQVNDKAIKVLFVVLCLSFSFFSCNEKEFLKTEPVEFYSPANSYITSVNYEAAIMNLYARVRDEFYSSDSQRDFPSAAIQATDVCYQHKNFGFNTDMATILLPTNESLVYEALWGPAYRIIYDANVIIGRAASDDNELTAEEKIAFAAEAKFFRGYMYKMLANLYGNVPIVLEETKSPRRDYVSASRADVYAQAAADLKDASDNLNDINEVEDHRISKLAALHLLSEVYISLEQWSDAIAAASVVIDHSSTALMTERFGDQKKFKALLFY